MIDVLARRTGKGQVQTFSEHDADLFDEFYINEPIRLKATRASKVKSRSYKELCCYKGSCQYIANMNFNENINTKLKVDTFTKVECDFTEGIVYSERYKQTTFIPKSLSYKNCDQPESHAFIAKALKLHAELVGMSDVNKYVRLLDEQK